MFDAPSLVAPMVVDYLGQVIMHALKKGIAGKYVCNHAVPKRYKR